RLVRQRTGLVNALRAHLAEFGIIAPQGLRNVGRLIAIVRDEDDARLPELARQVLRVLAAQIEQLEAAVSAIEKQLVDWHRSNPVSQRLATIPGIGPIILRCSPWVEKPAFYRPFWPGLPILAGRFANLDCRSVLAMALRAMRSWSAARV